MFSARQCPLHKDPEYIVSCYSTWEYMLGTHRIVF